MKAILHPLVLCLLCLSLCASHALADVYGAIPKDPTGWLAIRQAPNGHAAIVGKVYGGDDVVAQEENDDWCRVTAYSREGKLQGFVLKSQIREVDSREVVVKGKKVKYRLILNPGDLAEVQRMPRAIQTGSTSYIINPISKEKMYVGFLRTQAIITDPATGKEFGYDRPAMALSPRTAAAARTRAGSGRQGDAGLPPGLQQLLFAKPRIAPAKYAECGVCHGTGKNVYGGPCGACNGTGSVRLIQIPWITFGPANLGIEHGSE